MLKIRKEQNDELAKVAVKRFEDRVLVHLKKFWPDECKELTEQGVHKSIRTGIDNAGKYGIKTEYDVARYIDLMYTLCFDFDTNSQAPWASRILNDANMDAREKMDKLYECTERELQMLADQQVKQVRRS